MTGEVLAYLVLRRADVDVDETFEFLGELWSDALRGSLSKPKKAARPVPRAGGGPRARAAAPDESGRPVPRAGGGPRARAAAPDESGERPAED
jgi:hypothetical protein